MPARRARATSRRPRVLEVDAARFSSGFRRVHGEVVVADAGPTGPPPLVVDVVRPRDLVALTFEAHGCELVVDADGPVLRPREGATARLVVRLPFQHLAERAIYEEKAPVPDEAKPHEGPEQDPAAVDGENARPEPPIPARPARASRLVFDLPAGEQIPFSTEGLLAALSRLQLLVHPLAVPGEAPAAAQLGGGLVLHLPGGLVGVVSVHGLVIDRAARRQVLDTSTVAGLAIQARDLRRARTVLVAEGGTLTRRATTTALDMAAAPTELTIAGAVSEIPPLLGPGGLVERVPTRPRPRPRPRPRFSRPPTAKETAIEAPYRLVISPSTEAAWAHALLPVAAADAPHRVELWHTRLARRQLPEEDGERPGAVDERPSPRRIVRAVWARDREHFPDWQSPTGGPVHVDEPFRTSLDGADRHMLVRQSAETWLGKGAGPIAPVPAAARALWLSALGAWLDLHGQWTTLPYSEAGMPSILSWDHVAPLGRDEFVRVVYPGYLYPFGHRAALVKVTERKMKDPSPSLAGLYQRKFLVVGEPMRRYDYDGHRDLPFTEVRVRPLVTPTLDDPGPAQDSFFWPEVGNQRFRFVLDTLDHEGRPVRLTMPLLWVAEHFQSFGQVDQAYAGDDDRVVAANGQKVAFTPVVKGGDTMAEAASLTFLGQARLGGSRPRLEQASVALPAVQKLSPVGPVTIAYSATYRTSGFGGTANSGEVWAELPGPTPPQLSFGADPAAGSDRAGGFLQPDLPIRGLSRLTGAVGDPAGMATQDFDPATFLAGALPKLFGIVPLDKLLQAVLDAAPSVVSEALDRIEGLLADLERAKQAGQDALADANRLVQRAQDKAAEVQQQAQDALSQAQQLEAQVTGAVDDFVAALGGLAQADETTVAQALTAPLDALRQAATSMEQVAPRLPPLVRSQLESLAKVLRQVLDAADLVEDLYRMLNGLDPSSVEARFRFEWRPPLQSWPSPANPFLGITDPILEVQEDSLVLAVDGRASGKGQMGVEVLAELRDFTLHLLPGVPLVRIPFEHLSFKAGTSGKPDVDVVVKEIEFVGILSFVETLKELIPFDGFSDPPYLEVAPEGLTAGFNLTLPNVAIGVFSLSNIALGADLQVPFLGKAVTVGFLFCTRERPFTLAVAFLGGGGWFMVRLSPDGLDVLELGLEAGATLAIDLGVASGSISAMIGIYMRLEGQGGSLAGYFRLRGEVDVLGLISASIELYLELRYEFDTGKMVGRATITVEVEVFVFSGTVSVSCERRFAGSNGDPTFAEVMAVQDDATSAPWTEYCLAFGQE